MKKGGNPQNLKPFKPGQSGNPNGRPKKLPELDKLLSEVLGEEDGDEAKLILLSLVKQAKKGNVRAAEVLLERAYGKVKEKVEYSGDVLRTYKIVPASQRTGKPS